MSQSAFFFMLFMMAFVVLPLHAQDSYPKQNLQNLGEQLIAHIQEIPLETASENEALKPQETLTKEIPDQSQSIPQIPTQINNQSYIDCLKDAMGYTAVASAIGGGATAAVGSTAALSAAGFTSGGVAAGSMAAGVHSAIAVAEAGSAFAYLQSAGAMATGVFGAAFWPVTIGVGLAAGSGYVYSQCGLPPL